MSRWPSDRRAGHGTAVLICSPSGVFDTAGQRQAADWSAWCAAQPAGRRVWLLVSAACTHELVCENPLPLTSANAVREHATFLFRHYHGPTASAWALAPWRSGSHRGATALHGVDLRHLQKTARSRGLRLLGVQPLWAAALHGLLRLRPALAAASRLRLALAEDSGVVSMITLQAGHCMDVECTWVQIEEREGHLQPAVAAAAALKAPGDASCLLACHARPGAPVAGWEALDLADLLRAAAQTRASWWSRWRNSSLPDPEWLQEIAPPIRSGMLAAGLACALCATVGLQAWQTWTALQAQLRQAAEIQVRPATVQPVKPETLEQRDARRRTAHALHAVLHHPWPAVFSDLEQAAAADVQWISLEHSAGTGQMRLEGEADADAAVQLLSRLTGQRVWIDVNLNRLQPAGPPQQDLRAGLASSPSAATQFEISARWSPAKPVSQP